MDLCIINTIRNVKVIFTNFIANGLYELIDNITMIAEKHSINHIQTM